MWVGRWMSSRRPYWRGHSSGVFVPRRLSVGKRWPRHRPIVIFVKVSLPIFEGAGGTISHGGSRAARTCTEAKSSKLDIQAWIDGLCREIVCRLSAQRARRRDREWLRWSWTSPCWRSSWVGWRHELRRRRRPGSGIAGSRWGWSRWAVVTTGPRSRGLRTRRPRGGCCHSRAHAIICSLVSPGPLSISPSGKIAGSVGMSWSGT